MKIKHRLVYFTVYGSYDFGSHKDELVTNTVNAVVPSTWSDERVCKGFYIDNFLEITEDNLETRYFVSPASVLGIEKVEEDTDSV